MSQFWSKAISDLTPYTPGEQPQIDNLIKLNTNENPYGPSPKVIKAIADANSDDLRKYPDPLSIDLKKSIAAYYDLPLEYVFVGNSSDEVLAHAFRALLKHDKPLLYPDITYSFYPVYCQLFDIKYQTIALRDDFTLDIDDYQVDNGGIIFANPNAPTGIALSLEKIELLLQRNPSSVIVVDEAYADFAEHSAVSLVQKYDNLLVTQTLSKSRSLAGLRVGLALGNPQLLAGLERVKNSFHPYAIDKLAAAGAAAAFDDKAYFEVTREKVITTRQTTTQSLEKLGFDVLPSSTNFVFVRHPDYDAGMLYKGLREQNILVRHFSAQRIDQHLRISIGTDAEMTALIDALTILIRPA